MRLVEKRAAAKGDGGNDVSMIQAASVGIGVVTKEGRQASLAADFSLTQFSHIVRLLLVQSRNSYQEFSLTLAVRYTQRPHHHRHAG